MDAPKLPLPKPSYMNHRAWHSDCCFPSCLKGEFSHQPHPPASRLFSTPVLDSHNQLPSCLSASSQWVRECPGLACLPDGELATSRGNQVRLDHSCLRELKSELLELRGSAHSTNPPGLTALLPSGRSPTPKPFISWLNKLALAVPEKRLPGPLPPRRS